MKEEISEIFNALWTVVYTGHLELVQWNVGGCDGLGLQLRWENKGITNFFRETSWRTASLEAEMDKDYFKIMLNYEDKTGT
jgi:hypothetical protein